MGLDIRIPIGSMFAIIGALLAGYGIFTNGNAEMYKRSLSLNINLYWGLFLFAFGAIMLICVWMDRCKGGCQCNSKKPTK